MVASKKAVAARSSRVRALQHVHDRDTPGEDLGETVAPLVALQVVTQAARDTNGLEAPLPSLCHQLRPDETGRADDSDPHRGSGPIRGIIAALKVRSSAV